MKKIMLFVVAILTIVVVSGCSQIQSIVKTQLSSASSLATLSYVSSSFLDTNVGEEPTAASFYQLNDENLDTETELDSELDEVNIYLDKLKVFIENGTDSFGNIVVQESDNELYNLLSICKFISDKSSLSKTSYIYFLFLSIFFLQI